MKYLILLLALAISGCATSQNVQDKSQAKWNKTTVEVHWLPKARVGEICHSLGLPDTHFNGCARSKPDNIAICEVYVVQPDNFEDLHRLETLGHEVWHCLGANHS